MSTIKLSEAKKLAKRLGDWIWDGLMFNRDGIIDPDLVILPNKAGSRIRRFIREIGTP